MLLLNNMDWIFYNFFVFVGSIFLFFVVFLKIIFRSFFVFVGKYGKVRISKSKIVRCRLVISIYLFFVFGIVFLFIGFKDKFDYGKIVELSGIS